MATIFKKILENALCRFTAAAEDGRFFSAFLAIKTDAESNGISIPKFMKTSKHDNRLKRISSRTANGKTKSGTISQDKDGKYYISSLCEANQVIPAKPEALIGIDFGARTFLTFDDGTKTDSPSYSEQPSKKSATSWQELAKLRKDATAYRSKKEQITRLRSKITRQRKDFSDKLTHKRGHENRVGTIRAEDLPTKEMKKENRSPTNKKIGDSARNMLVNTLQYKANRHGKNAIKTGKPGRRQKHATSADTRIMN